MTVRCNGDKKMMDDEKVIGRWSCSDWRMWVYAREMEYDVGMDFMGSSRFLDFLIFTGKGA